MIKFGQRFYKEQAAGTNEGNLKVHLFLKQSSDWRIYRYAATRREVTLSGLRGHGI